MESQAIQKVRDARSALLLTHPFFGVLSLKLKLREDPTFPTAGVNTKELVFNPAFTESMTGAELKGLIAHEVMHLALLHPMRQGSRNQALFNIACDYAINGNLLKDGFTLPQGGLVDARFDNMSAEQIYRQLESEMPPKPQGGKGQGDGTGDPNGPSWGTFDSPGPEGSAETEDAAREWSQNAIEAIRAAKSAGLMPAGTERLVKDAANPRAPWEHLLRRFMTDQVRVKSTWSRKNKRFPDIYLPGRYKDGMGCLVLGVDTSGSIDSRMLARFSAEINAISEDVEPAEIHVVYCDAQVNRVDSFEHGTPVTLKACGGGGTRFSPVFDRVEKEGWQPAALVYLTDLECSDYPQEPGYPVLWANYGRAENTAPIGEVIHVE